MHKFSKTGWEICDFTLRSRLGFSYVIPGIIMSSWNTSNCYVTFPRDLLDFTVFSDMMFCQLFLPEWLCGVSMEYSGGFLKMLGIFPESFLLPGVSVCVCGEGEPGGVANGLVPRNRPGLGRRKVRSEWLLPSSGRTALHLEHQWTPRMFSLTWRNIAPFKITAAPIFVKRQDDRKVCILWGWWCHLRTFVLQTLCQWCTKPPVVLSSKYAILVRRYGLFRDEIFLYWFCVNDTQSTSWHCHRLKRARIDQILMHIVSHMLGADLKAVSSSLLVKVAEQRILQVIYHWFCAV